jgi:hypothetical protein
MRMMLAAALVGAALVAAPAAQDDRDARPSDSLERDFPAGGRIQMDLSAGEYEISGSPDNKIRLEWRVRRSDQLEDVRARADVRGTDAMIRTSGPSNRFSVSIQVPSRSALYIRLTAGELRIQGIEGDKDIGLHAGEIDVDVGRPESYASVDASLWAGEIRAQAFGGQKEGLFRSLNWSGEGKYRLRVRLKAGELRLHSDGVAER